jgi:hypothetical protein
MIHDLLLAVFTGTGIGIGIIVLVTIIDFGGTDEHYIRKCGTPGSLEDQLKCAVQRGLRLREDPRSSVAARTMREDELVSVAARALPARKAWCSERARIPSAGSVENTDPLFQKASCRPLCKWLISGAGNGAVSCSRIKWFWKSVSRHAAGQDSQEGRSSRKDSGHI